MVTASPRRLRDYAKVVNGPAWYPESRVRPLHWLTINGSHMRAVYVPPATNDGSAFMYHVVLISTVGQHTDGAGFHNERRIAQTLALDRGAGERAQARQALSDQPRAPFSASPDAR